MKKKFGTATKLGDSDRVETIAGTDDGQKWTEAIGDQLANADAIKSINVKTIPVDTVLFEPGNPRELRITPDEIRENYAMLMLPPKALQEHADDDWMEDYENSVAEVFPDDLKKNDFMSIALFAASLKSADRLLNPIVVWREDTLFYKITGERRYLAHVLLKEPNIAARIYEQKPSKFQISCIQWEENYQREDLCLHDALRNLRDMVEGWKLDTGNESITAAQFQNMSGMSRANGARYLRILTHASERLWDAMKVRKVDSLTTAYQLAAVDAETCDKELEKIFKGAPGTSAKEIARERAEKGERTRRRRPTKIGRVPNFINPTFVRRARPRELATSRFLIMRLQESMNSQGLEEELEKFDLETPKGIGAALDTIYKFADRITGGDQPDNRDK